MYCRVSLNDLEIVLPASADVMDRSEYLDILNGNLVYLCNKQSDSAIVDCFGIGTCDLFVDYHRRIFP